MDKKLGGLVKAWKIQKEFLKIFKWVTNWE